MTLSLTAYSRRYRFDSSVGRGDFKTPIGVGKVIRGAMTLLPAFRRLRFLSRLPTTKSPFISMR